MAYQKLQVSDGLAVIPSDTINIPDPTTAIVLDATTTGATIGTADFSVAGTLTDVGTKFTEAGIKAGAIIYNTQTAGGSGTTDAVLVLDFGADKSSSSGDFQIVFPTADSSNAIIRIA